MTAAERCGVEADDYAVEQSFAGLVVSVSLLTLYPDCCVHWCDAYCILLKKFGTWWMFEFGVW